MRVIQTRNDTIRLIFNPKTDGLCLSDFLIVRDNEDNFLGQIVEIYDDKFNQEENVATIRLVFRILSDRQVVPYDNYTPSRECEIAKIKLEEIEKCLNIDKTTVPFGISTKNNKIVNLNLNFFNNNPVIFADKLDEVNCAFENIAQKLKAYKKVVVIDYTGNLNIQNAKRIKAKDDFKLPLDYYSLEYIWEKALNQLSIEAQAELEDMFIELQKFVSSTEDKYIPFPRFIKVIEQQYKLTPAVELKLLLTRLKKYWAQDLFSRSKKEFQGISKAIQKEDVIIVDLSNLKLEWHREFLEFVVRQIRDYDAYLLLRLNENNSNPEIINNLYLKNPKLNIIPSISYGFVKLPQVMEFARNYILYKTLNPRRDFGFANFQVASLNSSSFLVFGKDTMDFMFVLKNYIYNEEDLNKEEEKKLYIDLNLELEEMTSVELAGGDFELKNIHIQGVNSNKNHQSKKDEQESLKKNRLSDEVALDDVLPQTEEKTAPREIQNEEAQNEIYNNTDEKIETDTPEAEFQDIPLIKEENKEENREENLEETQEEIGQTEEEIEESADNPPVNNPSYTLEEVGASSTDVPVMDTDDIQKDEADIQNSTDDADIIDADVSDVVDNNNADDADSNEAKSSDMAQLIEESLKNDEEYMRELSKKEHAKENEEQTSDSAEIPVAEEDLDYFINPANEEFTDAETSVPENEDAEKNEDTEDEIITTEMIEDAAANEELANEIEEQAKAHIEETAPEENKTLIEDLKKNSSKEENSSDNKEDDDTSLHQIKAQADNVLADENDAKEINSAIMIMEAKEAETLATSSAAPNPEENTKDDIKEDVQENGENPSSSPVQNIQDVQDAVEQEEQEEQESGQEEENENKPADEAQKESASKEPVQKEPAQKEPVIIVKEKPNLVIDDFTEDADDTKVLAQEENAKENVEEESLKELAQKSIDARFDEVIGETKTSKTADKNKLKITENVSIDLNTIKNADSSGNTLPVFSHGEDANDETDYNFTEGMKVSHEKYGTGNILKVVKYSNRCLLQIEFDETGKRLLDPKIARIKPVE